MDSDDSAYAPVTIDLAAAVISDDDLDGLQIGGFIPGKSGFRLPESFTEGPYPEPIRAQWRDAFLAGVYRRSFIPDDTSTYASIDSIAYEFATEEGAALGYDLLTQGWPGITMPHLRGKQCGMFAAGFPQDDGSTQSLTHMFIRVGRLLGHTTFMTLSDSPLYRYEQRLLDHMSERAYHRLQQAEAGETPGLFLIRPYFREPTIRDTYVRVDDRPVEFAPLAEYVIEQPLRNPDVPDAAEKYTITTRLTLFDSADVASEWMGLEFVAPAGSAEFSELPVEEPINDLELQRSTWRTESGMYVCRATVRTDSLVSEYTLSASSGYPAADPIHLSSIVNDNLHRGAWTDYNLVPDAFVTDAMQLGAWVHSSDE